METKQETLARYKRILLFLKSKYPDNYNKNWSYQFFLKKGISLKKTSEQN